MQTNGPLWKGTSEPVLVLETSSLLTLYLEELEDLGHRTSLLSVYQSGDGFQLKPATAFYL